MVKTTTELTLLPDIEKVDDLLDFLGASDLSEEQKSVMPYLWFQYTVSDIARLTNIPKATIHGWLGEPLFSLVLKEGRARRREMMSRYLYQAGYLGFQKMMGLLQGDYDDVKMIQEQQKTARFVVGELNIEPEVVEHKVDTRVYNVTDAVKERVAQIMTETVVDTMPKLLTLPCVNLVEGMTSVPQSGTLNVFAVHDEYLMQCHVCRGWFNDFAEHVSTHDMSPRKYADKYNLTTEVFELAHYITE